jgi:4-alpha-glucanotransferase
LWRAAGVAVPVFSLRSENSFGVGEFADLKLLADWAEQTNYQCYRFCRLMIQQPPISGQIVILMQQFLVYALHPQYLSLDNLTYPLSEALKEEYEKKRND